MSKAAKLGITALNFCGWVLILAAACYNQNKVGRKAMNFPLDWYGAGMAGYSPTMSSAYAGWTQGTVRLAPGGKALSYLWWITAFQFFGVLLAVAATSKPQLRTGSAAVFAVLTASTFLYTYDVYSAESVGIYALTHDSNLNILVPTKDNMPWRLYAYYKGAATLLAGLILCDAMNLLSCLVLPIGDDEAPKAAEAPAAESKGETV